MMALCVIKTYSTSHSLKLLLLLKIQQLSDRQLEKGQDESIMKIRKKPEMTRKIIEVPRS